MDALRILFYFSLLIGPLVLFHELGHYLAARYFGVKCEEFAIGFGPRIFSAKPRETEFSLRIFPLGGYVRMVGEHSEEPHPDDKGRALTDKALWQRAIIFLAGPLMNLMIPIPVFFMFMMLAPGVLPPEIGSAEPGFPAYEAGLQAGDVVLSINGSPIDTFEEFQRKVAKSAGTELTVVYDRGGDTHTTTLTPDTSDSRNPILPMRLREQGRVGVQLTQYGSVIHIDSQQSEAAAAGLRTFDTIIEINGTPVQRWSEIAAMIQKPGTHTLTVLRPQKTEDAWGDVKLRHRVQLQIEGKDLTQLGIQAAQQSIWSVIPGSPAEQAGLQVGDRVTEINGRPQTDLTWVLSALSVEPDRAHTLTVVRDGETRTLSITPEARKVVAEFRSAREEIFIGFQPLRSMHYPDLIELPLGKRLLSSFTSAVRNTSEVVVGLVMGVAMLFTGEVGTDSLGGPFMIADVASQAARGGLEQFIAIMALISVNLGVLNLLPIPGLDGGQLAVLGLEAIKRGPLSLRTRQLIHFIGLACLLLLMLFVFKNDIERYWRSVADWLNS